MIFPSNQAQRKPKILFWDTLRLKKRENFAILISKFLILHTSFKNDNIYPPNHTTVAFVHLKWREGGRKSSPPPKVKAHTQYLKPFHAVPGAKFWERVVCASSQTLRLDFKLPTLCQRLEFMCTLTWGFFPFPVKFTWMLFRRPNGHWVTLGQRSNTWRKKVKKKMPKENTIRFCLQHPTKSVRLQSNCWKCRTCSLLLH